MQWNIWGTGSCNLYPHSVLLLILKRAVSSCVCATRSITSHFPLSPAGLGSCCSADVRDLWERFSWILEQVQSRQWSSDSGLACRKQFPGTGVWWRREHRGGESGEQGWWSSTAVLEEELQQQLGLPVLCGCSHNGVQSSDPIYTPTPRAVWWNRLCEGGLEDWVYKESRATFLLGFFGDFFFQICFMLQLIFA